MEEQNVEFHQIYGPDGTKIISLESTQTYEMPAIFAAMLFVAHLCSKCAVQLFCNRQVKKGGPEYENGQIVGNRIEIENLDLNGPLGTDDCEWKPFRPN